MLTNGLVETSVGTNALADSGGQTNTAIGYNTGRGITTGAGNTIVGANVTGLSPTLTNTVVVASSDGVVKLNIDSTGQASVRRTDGTYVKVATLDTGLVSTNLLVYATQTTAITSNGAIVSIPFSTQPLFTSSLFSGGIFTPTVTGLYRFTVSMASTAGGSVDVDTRIDLYQGSTLVYRIYYLTIFGNSDTYTSDGAADLVLTAGVAYNVRGNVGFNPGSFSVGTGIVKSLTIERLT